MRIALIALFVLVLSATCYSDLIIRHQPREDIRVGNTELGLNDLMYNTLFVQTRLEPTWEREQEIFILPKHFYGQSELYTLGFYVDYMNPDVYKNDIEANWFIRYYILGEVEREKKDIELPIVHEPYTILFFIPFLFCLYIKRARMKLALFA